MGGSGQHDAVKTGHDAAEPVAHHYSLRMGRREIPLNSGETLIGRGVDCHVVISEGLVSRRHARVMMEGGRPHLEDLGSANGTFVNQARLHGRVELFPGDQVFVGTCELEIIRRVVEERLSSPARNRSDALERNTPESGVSKYEPVRSEGPPTSSSRRPITLNRLETQRPKELSETESFDYVGRLADKMLALGRVDAAQNLLEEPVNEWLASARGGKLPPPNVVDAIGRYAVRLGGETLSGRWVNVAIELHLLACRPLREETIQQLASLRAKAPLGDTSLLLRYYERLRAHLADFSAQDRILYERVACLVPGIEEG